MSHGPSYLTRVTGALGALLLVALVVRAAWELLQPTIPALLVLFILLFIFRLAMGRRGW